MANEKVKGEDQEPTAKVNEDDEAGRYKVTAKDGIRLDGKSEPIEKGEEVTLDRDAARALLNEGSIKRVED